MRILNKNNREARKNFFFEARRKCSIKATSTDAILTLNGSNITLIDQRFSHKQKWRNPGKLGWGNILKTIQEIENSGLWGMFPVRISIQMGGKTVIVDLISFHNLLHCAIPFFLLRESPENYKLQGWLWRWRNIPKSIAEILGGKYGEILVGGHISSSPPWASRSTVLVGARDGAARPQRPNRAQ